MCWKYARFTARKWQNRWTHQLYFELLPIVHYWVRNLYELSPLQWCQVDERKLCSLKNLMGRNRSELNQAILVVTEWDLFRKISFKLFLTSTWHEEDRYFADPNLLWGSLGWEKYCKAWNKLNIQKFDLNISRYDP